MALAPQPIRHHYVQRAHLALFTNDDEVLTVRGKQGNVFVVSPEAVFAENNLYSYESEQGVTAAFEEAITYLENQTFPALKELADSQVLAANLLGDIQTYLAGSYLRNPAFRSSVLAQHMAMQGHAPNAAFLGHIADHIDRVADHIGLFRFSLLNSPQGEFLVGDHPLTLVHPGVDVSAGYSFMSHSTVTDGFPFLRPTNKCELTFPVSKHVCLIARRGTALPNSQAAAAVEQANKRQALFAKRHLAAHEDSLFLENVAARYAAMSFRGDVQKFVCANGMGMQARQGVFPLAEWNTVKDDFVPLATLV